MVIGDLNSRITVQSDTKTDDGLGGYTSIPVVDEIVWANVRLVRVKELTIDDHKEGASAIIVTVRKPSKIKYISTLIYDNDTYNIVAIYNSKLNPKEYLIVEAIR